MIGAFKVRDTFSHTPEFCLLEKNCHAFAQTFETNLSEFFYYLKASDPERWFIIRCDTQDRDRFVSSAKLFGRNMDFEILLPHETKQLLYRIKLDEFI